MVKERHTVRNKARNRESKNGQLHNVDDHADDMTRSRGHLSQSGGSHIIQHAHCVGENVTCEVYLSTPRRRLQ